MTQVMENERKADQFSETGRKVAQFFSLIRSIYGASKYSQQWPTDMDIQAAQTMWQSEIDRHTPAELKAAIDHAQRMAASGEPDWQWPNIGMILSGARRYGTAAHRPFLPEPERNIPPPEKRAELMQRLRQEAGL